MSQNHDDADKAIRMAQRFGLTKADLKGKRLRVIRAVVYEGDAIEVMEQIAKSLPVGPKVISTASGRDLTITVVDDGLLSMLATSTPAPPNKLREAEERVIAAAEEAYEEHDGPFETLLTTAVLALRAARGGA